MGYEVVASVDTGEEAIRVAGELRPSLVIMDIGLAGKMNGIEAARQVRERFNIPVIFLTGHSDESTFWGALGSEPRGYIIKPFEPREMKYSIEMALHKHGKAPATGEGPGVQGGAPPTKGWGTMKKGVLPVLIIGAVLIAVVLLHPFAASPEKLQREKNAGIVREIAEGYHNTHTYLGVQTGQSGDIYVCLDMAKDVWNMIKTRGINAALVVGNVNRTITTIEDINHAWVLAEVGPMDWLAIETTGGYVVTKEENPLYYTGMQFDTPADMMEYRCGKGYCWSDTCVDEQCRECNPGFVLGADLRCHLVCGSAYCPGDSVCVDGTCRSCDPGYVIGTDNRCHPPCIDSNHYCLEGYTCGPDNKCHPEGGNPG
jgi:CheY-like chemotaxis protein